jgi:hypothetical protein
MDPRLPVAAPGLFEQREMRRSSRWTYRCPADHWAAVTVRGHDEPAGYGDLFRELHAGCLAEVA